MIGDAHVEVCCDYEGCNESVAIPLEWVYSSYDDSSGHYDSKDSSVEKRLVDEDWEVIDGKHYCPYHAEMVNEHPA